MPDCKLQQWQTELSLWFPDVLALVIAGYACPWWEQMPAKDVKLIVRAARAVDDLDGMEIEYPPHYSSTRKNNHSSSDSDAEGWGICKNCRTLLNNKLKECCGCEKKVTALIDNMLSSWSWEQYLEACPGFCGTNDRWPKGPSSWRSKEVYAMARIGIVLLESPKPLWTRSVVDTLALILARVRL